MFRCFQDSQMNCSIPAVLQNSDPSEPAPRAALDDLYQYVDEGTILPPNRNPLGYKMLKRLNSDPDTGSHGLGNGVRVSQGLSYLLFCFHTRLLKRWDLWAGTPDCWIHLRWTLTTRAGIRNKSIGFRAVQMRNIRRAAACE